MVTDHITHDERELGRREQKVEEIKDELVDEYLSPTGENRAIVDEINEKLETGHLKVYVENTEFNNVPKGLLRKLGKHEYFYIGYAINGVPGDNRAIFEFQIAEAFER